MVRQLCCRHQTLAFLVCACTASSTQAFSPFAAASFHSRLAGRLVAGGTAEAGSDCSLGGSEALHLRDPIDIALGPTGTFLVLDRECARVTSGPIAGGSAGSGGLVVAGTGIGGFETQMQHAQSLFFDTDTGFLYIADTHNQRVVRYSQLGVQVASVLVQGNGYTPNGDLGEPAGIVVQGGMIYVVEQFNHRIQQFELASCCADPNHAAGMTIFGCPELIPPMWSPPPICSRGYALDQLRAPEHLFVTPDGVFWIADSRNHRVLAFQINDTRANPEHDFSNYITVSRVVAGTTGIPGCKPEQLRFPTGIAVDGDGFLYVSDTGNHRVQKFATGAAGAEARVGTTVAGECCCTRTDGDGEPVGATGLHQLNEPAGIAFDDDTGTLLVVDRGNRRVLAYGGSDEVPTAALATCAYGVECILRLRGFMKPQGKEQIIIAKRDVPSDGTFDVQPISPCGKFSSIIPSWPGFRNPQAASGPFLDTFSMGVPRGPSETSSLEIGEYAICLAKNPSHPCVSGVCRGADNCSGSDSWLCGAMEPFGIRRKAWLDVYGGDLDSLRAWPAFPDSPDFEESMDLFEAPIDWRDNYGQQLYGLFVAPETGSYTFHITSDEHSELRVSNVFNETSGELLCYISGSSVWWNIAIDQDPHYGYARDPQDWTSFSTQSGSVYLEAGQLYWVDVIHKEGNGRDHLRAGVTLPNGTVYKPLSAAFFQGKVCVDGFPSGLGVVHDCDGKTTGQACTAECRGGFAGEQTTFYCDGLGQLSGANPVCEAVNCEEYDLEVGSLFMHGVIGDLDCTNMGGTDCSSKLGDWAGAGNCVAQVATAGSPCSRYCGDRGRPCVKGMDKLGLCTLNYAGHNRQTTQDDGCLQSWGDMICACGPQTSPVCVAPKWCSWGLMEPSGRPQGVHEDADGQLIVVDTWRHTVIRWSGRSYDVLAGGNAAGDGLDQLQQPAGVYFIEEANDTSLYIADTGNHRVLRWRTGDTLGEVAFGTGEPGMNRSLLRYPSGVYLDDNGTAFVVDYGNGRVLSFSSGEDIGELVDSSTARALPILPSSITDTGFDGVGNYYYVDYGSHRLHVCFRTLRCSFSACRDVYYLAEYGPSCGCAKYSTSCGEGHGVMPGGSPAVKPSVLTSPGAIQY